MEPMLPPATLLPPLLAGVAQSGEDAPAIQACNDFLRLGPGRTLRGVLAAYSNMPQEAPPTRSLDTLKKWSRRYGWPMVPATICFFFSRTTWNLRLSPRS